MPAFEPGQRVYSYASDECATVICDCGLYLSVQYDRDEHYSLRPKSRFVLADGGEQRHHERCVRPVLE